MHVNMKYDEEKMPNFHPDTYFPVGLLKSGLSSCDFNYDYDNQDHDNDGDDDDDDDDYDDVDEDGDRGQ